MQEFDLIVIGGGPGGYLCAERAGKAGLRTALIEKRALGGTCLNEGCIPTKSLLYCAKQYQAALHGAEYGVTAQNVSIDHAQVVARKDGVVRTLVRGVGAAMKAHGVTVFAAEGRILGKTGERFEIAAGGETLSAPRLVLASGSSAVIPPIPGVREGLASGFVMTNRELLSLSEQPESLVCIGGGVIGLEMACYFASIGTKVTVIEMLPKIAGSTDPEICELLMRTYKKQGMDFCLNARVEAVTERSVVYSDASGRHEIACGRVLLSAGRPADAHERPRRLGRRRLQWQADAGPHGLSRGRGRGQRYARQKGRDRLFHHPLRDLHHAGGRLRRRNGAERKGKGTGRAGGQGADGALRPVSCRKSEGNRLLQAAL